MKIESIKISNLFSFKYKENIEDIDSIKFGENLNILIGPNGAGKSNFIEIVSQLFKRGLLKQENFNESIIKNNNANLHEVLTYGGDINQSFFNHLQKNKFSDSDKKQILIDIALNKYDFENIKFVIDNLVEIKKLFSKYGSNIPLFNENVNVDEIRKNEKISVLLSQDATNQNPSSIQFMGDNTKEKDFLKWYIEHFEFIKRIIEIYNKYEKPENKWPQLKNTFALIGCYRNYNAFSEGYPITPDEQGSINEAKEKIKNESTRSGNGNNEPAVFDLIKRKLAYRYNYLLNNESLKQEEVEEKMREEDLLKNINSFLKEYLRIEVFISRTSDTDLNHRIYFKDDEHNQINIEELSAGEKGILHFIFSLYGYDLKNGLMIIDEPELHLHPQIQQAYLKIMEKVKKEFDVQFIFATHSPLFVNIDTINNVYRFYQENKATKIINPTITENDKDLVRILNYTNSARIFFSNKVILIEGESDEFFYRKFWDYYKKEKGIDKDELEFINIEGKGKKKLWEEFLKKFRVSTYFIGDWDNIENLGILDRSDMDILSSNYSEEILGKFAEEINKKNSNDRIGLVEALNNYLDNQTLANVEKIKELRDHMVRRFIPYGKLVAHIKEKEKEKYDEILKKINEEYKNNIFILKDGELEDYLNVEKGLGSVIKFCKEDSFNQWISNSQNKDFIGELEMIFDNILK